MTVKQELAQLREADLEIAILENTRAAAFAQATRATVTPTDTGIKSQIDPHRFDGLAILDDELVRRINALAAAKTNTVKRIYQLEKPRYREILTAYYINSRTPEGKRKTWEDVQEELFLSWSSLMQDHRNALLTLEKLRNESGPAPLVCSLEQ